MLELSAADLPTVATYTDMSGTHTVSADSEYMVTVITDADGEVWDAVAEVLTRQDFPGFDWSEWMHTDTFGSCPDLGAGQAVIINGVTYSADYAEGVVLAEAVA